MTQTVLRPLTPAQRRVYEFIRDHNAATRTGCGFRQINAALGFSSPNAAYGHVLALQAKGWIEMRPGVANSIVPTLDSLEVCDD